MVRTKIHIQPYWIINNAIYTWNWTRHGMTSASLSTICRKWIDMYQSKVVTNFDFPTLFYNCNFQRCTVINSINFVIGKVIRILLLWERWTEVRGYLNRWENVSSGFYCQYFVTRICSMQSFHLQSTFIFSRKYKQ